MRTRIGVAAPNTLATEAALALAEAGGSAVDAAIAATLVTMVTEHGVVSVAGGAFVTVAGPGQPAVTVDGSVEMPGRSAPPERFGAGTKEVTTSYGGGVTTTVGHGSVATPGALAALDLAHRRYGRAPWHEVVEPAVNVAESGAPLGMAAASYIDLVHDIVFGWDPRSHAALHHPDGSHFVAGEVVRVADLAETMRLVATEGADTLYRGDIAALLARDMEENLGLLGADDLALYEAKVRPSLSASLGGWRLSTNPPPAIGGAMLAAMLLLLDEPVFEWTPVERARTAKIMAAALRERQSRLDTADDRVAAAAALLDEVRRVGPGWLRSSPSTAHISVVDGDGIACAITTSSGYGSGVMPPGTGLWLNNCLGEPELNRGGLHTLPPGTRLPSNMAPTVGQHSDGSLLAIGSPGADRITTALFQVLAAIAGGQPLVDAIDAPRLHVHGGDDGFVLTVEDDLVVDADAYGLGLRVDRMPARSMYFGGVGAVRRQPSGRIEAAGDLRREGATGVLE